MIFCFSKKKSLFLKKKKKKKSFSYKKDNSLIENSWFEIKIMKILVVLDMVGPKSNIIQVRCCNKVSFIFRHSKSYWKNVLIVTNILYQTTDRRGNNIIFITYIKSKKQKKKKIRFRHTKSSWEKETTFHCSVADGTSYLKLIDDPRSK